MNASPSVNFLLSRNLIVFKTYFFLTHLYPFISFCFLHTYLIALNALHRYIKISLFVTHAFTPTKDSTPKRHFF